MNIKIDELKNLFYAIEASEDRYRLESDIVCAWKRINNIIQFFVEGQEFHLVFDPNTYNVVCDWNEGENPPILCETFSIRKALIVIKNFTVTNKELHTVIEYLIDNYEILDNLSDIVEKVDYDILDTIGFQL